MPEAPLISVIMPAHNVAPFIVQAISSVLNQNIDTLELIVINNGSTDNTGDIVRDFSDERIRLLEAGKLGPSGARNLGLQHARGQFITFLDADDIYLPETLKFFLSAFESQPELQVLYGGHPRYCDERLNPCPGSESRLQPEYTDLESFANRYPVAALFDNTINSQLSSIMLRAELIPTVGLFDTALSIGEDFEWILRLFKAANVKICLHRFVIHYRCNPASMMHNRAHLRKRLAGSRMLIKLIFSHDFGDAEMNRKCAYYAAKKWLDLCEGMTAQGHRLLGAALLKRFFMEDCFPKVCFLKRLSKLSVRLLMLSLRNCSARQTVQPATS